MSKYIYIFFFFRGGGGGGGGGGSKESSLCDGSFEPSLRMLLS